MFYFSRFFKQIQVYDSHGFAGAVLGEEEEEGTQHDTTRHNPFVAQPKTDSCWSALPKTVRTEQRTI